MKMETLLRGANFRPIEAQAALADLQPGSPMHLTREPGNQFDPNAVQVVDPVTEHHVGYVAKEAAAEIAHLLDDGAKYTCTLGERMDKKQWALEIEIEDVTLVIEPDVD
jgi:hypothetical protein